MAGFADPKAVRESCKRCCLAISYGMGAGSLARQLGIQPIVAKELMHAHERTFPQFWKWMERSIDYAIWKREIQTVFGWKLHLAPEANLRSVMNFPMQANGSEMLRLAACMATEAGIQVCWPVHDALVVMAPSDQIRDVVEAAAGLMSRASEIVLANKLSVRVDIRDDNTEKNKIFRHPQRFFDSRGEKMWLTVQKLITNIHPGALRACA
jgi:DNA polymerase I